MSRSPPRLIAALLVATLLSGCVTLLPKHAPARLYRFGGEGAGSTPGSGSALSVTFPAAAQGDGILTLTGQRAAYIADARWVSPAVLLFRETAQRLLPDLSTGPGPRGRLVIHVTRFEADYDQPQGSAPMVRVEAQVALEDGLGGVRRLGLVKAQSPAADNRVGAIVAAFDLASSDLISQIARLAALPA
jgi:cholesterol transport system auxiliary component